MKAEIRVPIATTANPIPVEARATLNPWSARLENPACKAISRKAPERPLILPPVTHETLRTWIIVVARPAIEAVAKATIDIKANPPAVRAASAATILNTHLPTGVLVRRVRFCTVPDRKSITVLITGAKWSPKADANSPTEIKNICHLSASVSTISPYWRESYITDTY